uniref:Uncharacterized protein n=1 Tax=Chrysemys picta bellii TaxID=8478 RepID=A0A8C3HC55_CHRPI
MASSLPRSNHYICQSTLNFLLIGLSTHPSALLTVYWPRREGHKGGSPTWEKEARGDTRHSAVFPIGRRDCP